MKSTSWILNIVTITITIIILQTTALGYDVTNALYFKEVAGNYQLTEAEINCLRNQGFVVITDEGRKFRSFGDVFIDVFKRDLPVFITTDAVLHGVHLAFDEMLQLAEEEYLYPMVNEMLTAMHQKLPEVSAPEEVKNDVDLFLSVARGLIVGRRQKSPERDGWLPPSRIKDDGKPLSLRGQEEQVNELLQRIQSHQMHEFSLYGMERRTDFSQFIPRGHYTASEGLERYFMTMMWLSREDLGFRIFEKDVSPEDTAPYQRQMMDSFLTFQLLKRSKQRENYRKYFDFVSYMVGEPDNPTLDDLEEACQKSSVGDVEQIARPETYLAIINALAAQDAIRGRISSNARWYFEPQPVYLLMLGQRFVLDSYVTSEVVYDRIPARRFMPSPLDVMYVLGNDTAKPLLKEELARYNYEEKLEELRQEADELSEDFWGKTAYHQWLAMLRTLHQAPEKTAPSFMKTKGWNLEKLNTQLASWAQLRHDTILYVKQSYSAIACEYPYGYVEPYAGFYLELEAFYEATQRAYHSLGIRNYDRYFSLSLATIRTLQEIVRKELACEPFTELEESFLQQTIKEAEPEGYGKPSPSGWYAELCFRGDLSTEWKPTVADVHTDPNPPGRVLEVAVGNVELCVIVANTGGDVITYVGPVFTYYEFTHPMNDRMTDEKWKEQLSKGNVPVRPEWAREYLEKCPCDGAIFENGLTNWVPSWDVNQDARVDILDLILIGKHLGKSSPSDSRVDVNGDGSVDISDLILVARKFDVTNITTAGSLQATTLHNEDVFALQTVLNNLPKKKEFSVLRELLYRIVVLEYRLIPAESALRQNYPNPFNPETWIPYQLANPAEVTITIYNIHGKRVRRFDFQRQPAGWYYSKAKAAYWNGRNDAGEHVANGVYFCAIQISDGVSKDFTATRKMLMLK